MSPAEPSSPHSPNGVPGLPPVLPPSGRFIAQLFLVPGMIVLVAVLMIVGINYLFIGGYTPQYFLSKLDSDNDDIRWRGAADLAQHIKRPESKALKTDVAFALDLAQRLRDQRAELLQREQEIASRIAKLPAEEQDREWRRLAKRRDFVEYLASALGDFYVPVGVPLLCDIVNQEDSPDHKGNTMRRRRAIWALSNLGAHLQALDKELTSEQRAKIVAALREEAAGTDAARKAWAQTGLSYLAENAVGKDAPAVVRVDRELARCAKTPDRYLREHIAMALNFWDGDTVEETLVQLARDDGFGELVRVSEND
jgi:hypothetical protein